MARHKAEHARITRRNWTIMAAGLWAGIFQRTQTHTALTRWVDLQDEIQEA